MSINGGHALHYPSVYLKIYSGEQPEDNSIDSADNGENNNEKSQQAKPKNLIKWF